MAELHSGFNSLGTIVPNTNNTYDLGSSALKWANLYVQNMPIVNGTALTSTFLQIANNLSDLNNVGTARTNLGLGSIATQAASNVAITGGSITGITDLAVADGGTGASDASGARTNLGLVIGTDVAAASHTHLLAAGATDVTATATELNYVDGVTSAIQTQLDGKAATSHTHLLAAGATDVTSTAAELNILDGATLTTTELNYVDGVTSAIQTQLDAKASTSHTHSHTDLTDIGTNTHAQIDTHIAATGTSAHGDSYLLNTSDTATGNFSFGGYINAGSTTAPSNTTAGDATFLRLHLGTDATQATNAILDVNGFSKFRTAIGFNNVAGVTPPNSIISANEWAITGNSSDANNLTFWEKTVSTTTARLTLTHTGDLKHTGYLRVGSTTAPTNTTAGDLTFVRGFGTSVELTNLRVGTSTTAGYVLTADASGNAAWAAAPGGGGGEANTSSNVGTGEGTLAKAKSGVDLPFKSLKQGTGITVTNNADDVTIAAKPATLSNQSLATQGPGFSTDTYLTGSNIAVDSRLQAGTRYYLVFNVTKTGAGTATPIINVRFGTTTTTGDVARLTFTFSAQTGVIDEGVFEMWVTFRTVGSGTSAVMQGLARLTHRLSVTGLGTGVSEPEVATSAGFDSTVASSQIGVSVNGGASAAWTVNLVQAELSNLA